jgi:hypothetical protein
MNRTKIASLISLLMALDGCSSTPPSEPSHGAGQRGLVPGLKN